MSNIRYLALRSRPVYDRVLVESYGRTLKQNQRTQLMRVILIFIAFLFACISAVVLPMWGAEFIKSYIENF